MSLFLKGKKSANQESIYTDVAQRRRRQAEIRLFVQALYENVLLFYQFTNFYYISALFENPWIVFFTNTFPWEVCLMIDG
ncbi:hypothetical protein DICVIV_12601 [Dictyocaulus viviparus]|uniref:7TM GPCR serpentine receptor class x (Srx) domain-containing protein n=1 Tax=Dictyocaulus viviparus TaxID=29172 RepID=A0A0D8XGB7_DICVI|nr:hypothetical protein DICVIV_12601 [Dictyocaulus viviparus]